MCERVRPRAHVCLISIALPNLGANRVLLGLCHSRLEDNVLTTLHVGVFEGLTRLYYL